MTETERKALALINEVRAERGKPVLADIQGADFCVEEALCRAIEQHEAYRRDVSAVVNVLVNGRALTQNAQDVIRQIMGRFIIAKPDPLVEAMTEAFSECGTWEPCTAADANNLRTALAARGGRIVFDGDAA